MSDRTFYQALLAQTGFLVFASVSHMNDRVAHWDLEVFTYITVKAHDAYILNSLAYQGLIV
jgi:hypothetical protein